jgi:hypothetical protein
VSKRFGRNQRRRVRELLSDCEGRIEKHGQALDMSRRLAEHLAEKLGFVREELAEAKEIAGRMSVLFPAGSTSIHGGERGKIMVFSDSPLRSFAEHRMDMETTMEYQRLSVMLVKIDKKALDEAVHIKVSFDDKCMGYAISESARLVRHGNSMERELARTLPKMISLKLFGGVGHD